MATATLVASVSTVTTAVTTNAAVADNWKLAIENCKAQLSPKELARVLGTPSYEELKTSINDLRRQYRQKSVTRALVSIEPFLQNLHSFNGVIDTAVQSKPEIAALCWGGIKLVIELSLRLTNAIERISAGMAQIGQILPRFDSYQNLLPSTPQLNQALISVYEAVVGFCFQTINILRKHPMRNWFRSLWYNYENALHKQLECIERQSRLVDVESTVAKMMVDETRHEATMKMLKTKSMRAPAILPCYSIPYAQNARFFGRLPELQFCWDALTVSDSSQRSKMVALHGIGGIGKTSVAIEAAYKEKTRRTVILWIAADDTTKLDEGYVAAAVKLELHQDNGNVDSDRDSVKEWLEKTVEPWLIVFDNVENLDDLQKYLPTGGNGSCLMTSRNPESQHGLMIEGQKIAAFDGDDGKGFLLGFLPNMNPNDPAIQASAESLNSYLGGSALGLKQMGAFIRETGCTIDDLLTSLRDKEQERDVFKDDSALATQGYSRSLANAWEVSLSALHETTMNILLFFSFMDPDRIPENITNALRDSCRQYAAHFPEAFSNIRQVLEERGAGEVHRSQLITNRFRQHIRILVRYGMIEILGNDSSFAIHRLIQANVLHFASHQARNDMFDMIISIFLQGHPQSQATSDTLFHHWATCAIYSPHILRLQSLMKDWKLRPKSPNQLWILFFNCSRYLLETGAMAKALSLIEDTEPFCDTSQKDGKLRLTYLHNARGLIALQHQKQGEARTWFEQAYAVRKEHFGEQDVNTIAVEGNLALTMINERRWLDLIAFNERRRESVSNLPHIPTRLRSSIHDLLSLAYLETQQLDKAWDAIETSTNLNKTAVNVYSQHNGYIHFNRGRILKAKGQLDDALREHLLGFEIRKQILGDHIQTAGSCYRTADLMARTGKLEAARDLLLESLKMYGNLGLIGTFGQGGKARSAWRLSEVMIALGKPDEAERYNNEARDRRRTLGKPDKNDLYEEDFNILLNYVDS